MAISVRMRVATVLADDVDVCPGCTARSLRLKLSRKSDYALRALVTLAGRPGQGPMSIRELAELNAKPGAQVSEGVVLAKLEKA